jgi:hypothetical protein
MERKLREAERGGGGEKQYGTEDFDAICSKNVGVPETAGCLLCHITISRWYRCENWIGNASRKSEVVQRSRSANSRSSLELHLMKFRPLCSLCQVFSKV